MYGLPSFFITFQILESTNYLQKIMHKFEHSLIKFLSFCKQKCEKNAKSIDKQIHFFE